MIKFTTTEVDDIPQIKDWAERDPFHSDQKYPEWWLTGTKCFLAGCIEDDSGPVFYFRIDRDEELARLNIQFAPSDVVGKRRVAAALTEVFPNIKYLVWETGGDEDFKGMVFESTSQPLIQFVESLGFCHRGNNDYVLRFGEN